ncbi:sulfotransferase family protein [Hasllibacter halocynthiae]|uniref:Sulfotransferase family protein n=1 Tax=Hasllibacter halocynthiae TaxID=595589 RepID=A0A2T0WZP9_9RHOB|nr:sulfotransferase [Hasllibacter halocynthiae]PRY92064.1 sulfotransferase family protein [Hasllibacter halocynthiae]
MSALAGGGLILGSARCGSTLVSRILRLHPSILSLSELFATAGPYAFRPARVSGARFWARLSTPSRAFSAIANPETAPGEFLYGAAPYSAHDPWRCPPILAVTLPHLSDDPDALFAKLGAEARDWGVRDLGDQYRALFAALARHVGGRRIWVERSGGSLVAARTLLSTFPEARPVLLLRDGAETALSMRDYPAARVAIWAWRRLRPIGIDLLGEAGHYGRGAAWPLVAALGGLGAVRRIAATQPSLTDCGAFWSAVTSAGLRALDGHAPLAIRYQDLCRAPRPEIERLGLYIAGDAPEAWLAAAERLPRRRPSRIPDLHTEERDELMRSCAPGEDAVRRWLGSRTC